MRKKLPTHISCDTKTGLGLALWEVVKRPVCLFVGGVVKNTHSPIITTRTNTRAYVRPIPSAVGERRVSCNAI